MAEVKPSGPGQVESAVAAELAGLAMAQRRPGLVAVALTLARTLDSPSFGSSHAALSRELRATLDALAAVRRGRGRLTSVTELAVRR